MLELNTIYCMDCLEGMKEMEDNSVDAIISDPPFAFAGGISNGRASLTSSQFFQHWLTDVFSELIRISKKTAAWFLWCDWKTPIIYSDALRNAASDEYNYWIVSQIIVHNREMVGMGSPFRNQLDWIALIKNNKTEFKNRIPVNQPNIINKYWYYGKHKYHPAEKDVEVSELLINWISDPHDTILDPFMGSGTTAVACAKLHRNFIGFELEQKYVDIANKRIEPWLQQTALTDYSTLEAAVC